MLRKLELRIFDGTRKLFSAPADFLITITDGNQTQRVRDYYQSNDTTFDVPFFDNFGDNYSVIVWAEGYRQAGFIPVTFQTSSRASSTDADSGGPGIQFRECPLGWVSGVYPFLGNGVDVRRRGAPLRPASRSAGESLACLLNITEAMSQIQLSQGSPLDYIKRMIWSGDYGKNGDYDPKQDRFFAWCDPALINQVKIAADKGLFAPELNPGTFHAGATSSWKQIQFGEANVQLTFHENDHMDVDGLDCVLVEPDIDYFKDLGAHAIFEVVPNAITHSLTDPIEVYVLRWMAGRQAGVPDSTPCIRSRPNGPAAGGRHEAIALQRGHEPGRFYRRPKGEYDWIVMDPDFDWKALYGQFDTC